MSKEIEAKFEAEGIIDETKTTLTINDGVDDKVYNILTDGTVLYNDWGISVECRVIMRQQRLNSQKSFLPG